MKKYQKETDNFPTVEEARGFKEGEYELAAKFLRYLREGILTGKTRFYTHEVITTKTKTFQLVQKALNKKGWKISICGVGLDMNFFIEEFKDNYDDPL